MAVGYEGFAEIDGHLVLVTSISAPFQSTRLESNSAYKGTTSVLSNQGIGYPHAYDWYSYDGSMTVEATPTYFNSWKGWLVNRTSNKNIRYQTRGNQAENQQYLQECYWTSISIEAAGAGSAVTSNISLMSWSKVSGIGEAYTKIQDNYIQNRGGVINDAAGRQALRTTPIPTLNKKDYLNTTPIPFWKTNVAGLEGDGSLGSLKLLNWSVTFNQDIAKQSLCLASSSPHQPSYVIFGPMTGEFTGSAVIVNPKGYFQGDAIITYETHLIASVGTGSLDLGFCQWNNFADDIVGQSDAVPINLGYQIYGPIK